MTQAQIEAAKTLVHRFEHESMALHRIQREWLQREIAAALAAAAEVEDTTAIVADIANERAAAAEIGEIKIDAVTAKNRSRTA